MVPKIFTSRMVTIAISPLCFLSRYGRLPNKWNTLKWVVSIGYNYVFDNKTMKILSVKHNCPKILITSSTVRALASFFFYSECWKNAYAQGRLQQYGSIWIFIWASCLPWISMCMCKFESAQLCLHVYETEQKKAQWKGMSQQKWI